MFPSNLQNSNRDEFGRFRKGLIPWNKGKTGIYSESVLKRMSDAKKGKHISPNTEFKKGNIPWDKDLKGLYIKGSEKGWFNKGHKWPKEMEIEIRKKIRDKVVLRPNLKINENLGYILGTLYGDGCVFINGRTYKIVLDVTNKKFADSFFNALIKIGLHPYITERQPHNGIGKLKKYIVIANSIEFGYWFKKFKIEELTNKEAIIAFIRGFYESEGNLYLDKNSNYCSAHIHNTNLRLLKIIRNWIESLGIKSKFYGPYKNNGGLGYKTKPLYKVSISYTKDTHKFLDLINPCIKNISGGSL